MPSRTKYRRLSDLYVQGAELVLKDGSVIWLQVLNPFELDEARSSAQAVRARLVMALEEHGSDETAKVTATFIRAGRQSAIKQLVDEQTDDFLLAAVEEVRNDPEWTERLEIVDRSGEDAARPLEDAERELLDTINRDYLTEINRRMDDLADARRSQYETYDEASLKQAYCEVYVGRRGGDLAMAEYRLTEAWHAARVCDGVRNDDGTWDHDACDGHRVRVWETKAEVRDLPTDLQDVIAERLAELNMAVREAKGSGRPGSSSDSSPQQNGEAASTPSTPDETPEPALGTSPQPSPTP